MADATALAVWQAVVRHCAARCVRWLFRVELVGLEHFHAAGPRVLIVANHVSLLDGVMLYLFLPAPPLFAVSPALARRWYVRPLLALAAWEPLDPHSPLGLKTLTRHLRDGRQIALFPENRMTSTGIAMKIYDGPAMIADKADATFLPVAIDGLEHSRASALDSLLRRRWFPQVTLRILPSRPLRLAADVQGRFRRAQATAQLQAVMDEIDFTRAFRRETLTDALVRAAHKHGPGQVILEDSRGVRLSYRQLLTRAFVLGAALSRRLDPGERLGVMLPSSAAAVVALFAGAARGHTVALLNFTGGVRNLLTALEIAQVRTVCTSRAFIELAQLEHEVAAIGAQAKILYLEDLRDSIGPLAKLAGAVAGRLPRLALARYNGQRSADDAAVILFTSGSEGIPKGVALSHANLTANYAQVQMLLDITRRDRVLNVLPVFHAFGLLGGVLLPLFKGTPTYQYPSPLHYHRIPELCYEIGATCLFGTNTFLRNYARHAHPYDLHRMRFVIAGAEKLTADTRELWADKFGIRIYEGYGATEGSPVLAANHPRAARTGTVGHLLTGIEHYLEPVAGIAEGGELVVRGPNIMLGYLFHGGDGTLIRPRTARAGVGWYATGDIVTLDADGYVVIKGRSKRFAKIAGEMVSLAATEELAAACWPDGCHAALALADARKGEQIVLVTNVVGAERAALVVAARERGVSERAVPRQVIHHDAIPLLGSGKINYPALRELVPAQSRSWFNRT